MGLLKNPKKAIYNKVYNKTTIGVSDLLASNGKKRTSSKAKKTNISKEKIDKLIENRMQDEDFKLKLESELRKNGYTMEDLYNEINKLDDKATFNGYDQHQREENYINSQVSNLISVDILVLWYVKNKKIPIEVETIPRYFNYAYHINFLERLDFLINNGYIDINGEKYSYTEKGLITLKKYNAIIQTHFDGEYKREKIDKEFNKIN